MYKTIILFLIVTLMTSCSALMIEGETSEHYFNYSPYNYDRVHYIYLNQPNYFQNTFYINQYGQQTYMYQHPYYVRYCRERDSRQRIESRKRTYVTPTVGIRVNKTHYVTNRRATSNTRTYTTHNSNNRTTYNSNNRTTSTNRNITTRRTTPTTVNRSTPSRVRTSTTKRR